MAKIEINTQRCKGCELCISVCPQHIISIGNTLNEHGYYVAEAQHMEQCTGCALCAQTCPDIAITVFK